MFFHRPGSSLVIVRMPNWIGDVCMSLPCLQLLKEAGMELVVVARPWAQPLIEPFAPKEFVSVNGTFSQDLFAVRKISARTRHDARGLILPDSLSSAALFYLTGISSAGYRDDGRSLLLRWPVSKPNQRLHASQKWAHLVREALGHWGLRPLDSNHASSAELPSVNFSPTESDQSAAFKLMDQFALAPHDFILIAPTATGKHRGQTKTWPHFAQLCQKLVEAGLKVIACPPGNERTQAQEAAPQATIVGPLSIGAFCALAAKASVVICNDSGAAHLSALVKARQITLFGVTDPADTAPLSTVGIQMGSNGQWPALASVLCAVNQTIKNKSTVHAALR